MDQTVVKKRTTLNLNGANVAAAKEEGINISEICDAAIVAALSKARKAAWLEENAAALREHDAWFEKNGHPFSSAATGPFSEGV